jgi:hypothetical protein
VAKVKTLFTISVHGIPPLKIRQTKKLLWRARHGRAVFPPLYVPEKNMAQDADWPTPAQAQNAPAEDCEVDGRTWKKAPWTKRSFPRRLYPGAAGTMPRSDGLWSPLQTCWAAQPPGIST